MYLEKTVFGGNYKLAIRLETMGYRDKRQGFVCLMCLFSSFQDKLSPYTRHVFVDPNIFKSWGAKLLGRNK